MENRTADLSDRKQKPENKKQKSGKRKATKNAPSALSERENDMRRTKGPRYHSPCTRPAGTSQTRRRYTFILRNALP